jgi:hypothetical protein
MGYLKRLGVYKLHLFLSVNVKIVLLTDVVLYRLNMVIR